MTVKELKEKLQNVPDNMEVFITQHNDEFLISIVGSAKVVEATFTEDSGPAFAKDDVFLITDEY